MSNHERNNYAYDNLQPAARLTSDNKKQVIRLVNPSDTKIGFVVNPNSLNSSLTISPRSGFIQPRNYTLISINRSNTTKSSSNESTRLDLIYLVRDPSRRRGYTRRLIPIDLVGEEGYNFFNEVKKSNFIWFVIRLMRSMLLIALIIYNMILIKVCFDN